MVNSNIKNSEECPLKETMQLAKHIIGIEGWELEALREYWEKHKETILEAAERVHERISAAIGDAAERDRLFEAMERGLETIMTRSCDEGLWFFLAGSSSTGLGIGLRPETMLMALAALAKELSEAAPDRRTASAVARRLLTIIVMMDASLRYFWEKALEEGVGVKPALLEKLVRMEVEKMAAEPGGGA